MLLVLDEKPRNPLQRIQVETRIFLKEGIRHWNWHQLLRVPGSVSPASTSANLLRELTRRNIPFSHNEFSNRIAYDHVWVMQDPLALRWAIEKKKAGQIKTLIAGPSIVTLPHEASGLIESPEIDAVVFTSPWIRDLFISLSDSGLSKTYVLPAGVDDREWQPGLGRKELTLIIDSRSGVLDPVVSKLLQKNYKVEILKTGHYNQRIYKQLLHKARFAVFLAQSEAQAGSAMFEAWSCGVPTIHWNPRTMKYFGKTYSPASSCYYLNEKCGMEFSNPDDFISTLDRFEWKYRSFSPRSFILQGYTLRHAVDRFLNILTLPTFDTSRTPQQQTPWPHPSTPTTPDA